MTRTDEIMALVGGCPVCSGDCAGANPPVIVCPMTALRAAVEKLEQENLQHGNVLGRIAIALFGDFNNRTDEECVAAVAELSYEISGARLRAERAEAELAAANDALQFVERWANHHGTKATVTAEQALSCIQHYPTIKAITASYADGKVPETRDPWAELAEARKDAELWRELGLPMLAALDSRPPTEREWKDIGAKAKMLRAALAKEKRR